MWIRTRKWIRTVNGFRAVYGWTSLIDKGTNGPKDGSTASRAIPPKHSPSWQEQGGGRPLSDSEWSEWINNWDSTNQRESIRSYLGRKGLSNPRPYSPGCGCPDCLQLKEREL